MGAVGGGIWHSVKGAKNSPKVFIRILFLFLKGETLIISIG